MLLLCVDLQRGGRGAEGVERAPARHGGELTGVGGGGGLGEAHRPDVGHQGEVEGGEQPHLQHQHGQYLERDMGMKTML